MTESLFQPLDADAFDACVRAAYAALPAVYRDACDGLMVRTLDLPPAETLASLGIADPYGLLGLYQGISLDRKSVLDTPVEPDMVFLYRLPILAYAARRDLTVDAVATHVLVHEIGHHFGFSDDDMEAIEES